MCIPECLPPFKFLLRRNLEQVKIDRRKEIKVSFILLTSTTNFFTCGLLSPLSFPGKRYLYSAVAWHSGQAKLEFL